MLVSSNQGFARAAFQYGQQHEEAREVSSVITDFSLANMAWLKAPMGAPSLPITEVLAFAYAALQPSPSLLDKYMAEIDKLEQRGLIHERYHQLLRSTLAEEELMRLTLGDEDALNQETVTETLRRITDEIKHGESEKLFAEKMEHEKTLAELNTERAKKKRIQEGLYWRCRQRAKRWSWFMAAFFAVMLLGGLAAGAGLRSSNPILGLILLVCSSLVALMALIDLIVSFSVRQARETIEERLLVWFIKREAAVTGIEPVNGQE